jgi:hypothetical protein
VSWTGDVQDSAVGFPGTSAQTHWPAIIAIPVKMVDAQAVGKVVVIMTIGELT